jgi:hypothetical protein
VRWPPCDVSSRGACLPSAMGACAPPLLRFAVRGRSRVRWRSRVCFAVGGRFLLRGRDPLSRSLVRRRTARQKRPYARRDRQASTSPLVHSCRHVGLHGDVARLSREQEASKVFPTAIHSLWTAPAASSDDAHSRRRTRAKPRLAPLSAIQSRTSAWCARLRDRHGAKPRPAWSRRREHGQPAPDGRARRCWTRARIGLIVPVCRFPSTRSCRAPRK